MIFIRSIYNGYDTGNWAIMIPAIEAQLSYVCTLCRFPKKIELEYKTSTTIHPYSLGLFRIIKRGLRSVSHTSSPCWLPFWRIIVYGTNLLNQPYRLMKVILWHHLKTVLAVVTYYCIKCHEVIKIDNPSVFPWNVKNAKQKASRRRYTKQNVCPCLYW